MYAFHIRYVHKRAVVELLSFFVYTQSVIYCEDETKISCYIFIETSRPSDKYFYKALY